MKFGNFQNNSQYLCRNVKTRLKTDVGCNKLSIVYKNRYARRTCICAKELHGFYGKKIHSQLFSKHLITIIIKTLFKLLKIPLAMLLVLT